MKRLDWKQRKGFGKVEREMKGRGEHIKRMDWKQRKGFGKV